MGGIRLSRICR